ncbi:hypothetical protein C4585_02585 [Candidatus Parcubacteria bacterium]|nr:MAG: hypothetical protein C4585_02585 [Candidatus Parcubacteria bacterium]
MTDHRTFIDPASVAAAGAAFAAGMRGSAPRSWRVGDDDPYRWRAGSIIGLIFAIIAGLIVVVVLGALLYNNGVFSCDSACWSARTEIALAHETTERAMANSNANSRAGFGNHDYTTGQVAVPKIPEPIIVYPPAAAPAPVYIVPPAGGGVPPVPFPPPLPTVRGGHKALLDGPGRCRFSPDGPMKGALGYEWPDGRCYTVPPPSA